MKYIKKFTSLFLSLVLLFSVLATNQMAHAANTTTIQVIGSYGQTEAQKMLSGLNNFRKSSDAWYWNADNKTKTVCRNLKSLTYDYELERIAMLRAAEVAIVWSHTRPNGQDCFTAFTYNAGTKGENIAAGPTTYDAALKLWREDGEKYSGQGHRRNMLSNSYSYVGAGHFVCGGVHFWVQEFAAKGKDSKSVTANDKETSVSINTLTSNITAVSVKPTSTSFEIINGTSASLPSVTTSLTVKGHWPAGGTVPVKASNSWTSSNTSVASVSGNTLSGKKVGTTTLTVKSSVVGKSASANITVNVAKTPDNGWVTENGKKKYYYQNGQSVKYRNRIDGKLYYFNGSGILQYSWIKGTNTFFADKTTGILKTDWAVIDGKKYYFASDGSMAKYTQTIAGKTYYFNGAGVMRTGWLKYNSGKWSYFDSNGVMLKNTSRNIGGKTYYFDASGKCTNR